MHESFYMHPGALTPLTQGKRAMHPGALTPLTQGMTQGKRAMHPGSKEKTIGTQSTKEGVALVYCLPLGASICY